MLASVLTALDAIPAYAQDGPIDAYRGTITIGIGAAALPD